jgi:hypothetical protein
MSTAAVVVSSDASVFPPSATRSLTDWERAGVFAGGGAIVRVMIISLGVELLPSSRFEQITETFLMKWFRDFGARGFGSCRQGNSHGCSRIHAANH